MNATDAMISVPFGASVPDWNSSNGVAHSRSVPRAVELQRTTARRSASAAMARSTASCRRKPRRPRNNADHVVVPIDDNAAGRT